MKDEALAAIRSQHENDIVRLHAQNERSNKSALEQLNKDCTVRLENMRQEHDKAQQQALERIRVLETQLVQVTETKI